MSILINSMEMPRKCSDCPVLVYGRCLVNDDKDVSDAASNAVQDRDCPLVPVPPHGDLINRDALCGRLEKAGKIKPHLESGLNVAISFALTAPTIIPAEECET